MCLWELLYFEQCVSILGLKIFLKLPSVCHMEWVFTTSARHPEPPWINLFEERSSECFSTFCDGWVFLVLSSLPISLKKNPVYGSKGKKIHRNTWIFLPLQKNCVTRKTSLFLNCFSFLIFCQQTLDPSLLRFTRTCPLGTLAHPTLSESGRNVQVFVKHPIRWRWDLVSQRLLKVNASYSHLCSDLAFWKTVSVYG